MNPYCNINYMQNDDHRLASSGLEPHATVTIRPYHPNDRILETSHQHKSVGDSA